MSHMTPIPFGAERRKQRKEETADREKSALRGVLGAFSRRCSQVAFCFAAYSSYLSEVSSSTVETIVDANALVHKTREAAREPLRI